jgi:hypothetical protein
MISDMLNIPTWAWVVLGFLFLTFIALAWGVCRASGYYSRLEDALRDDERRYNEDNAQAFARRSGSESGLYSRVPQHLYP